MATKKIEYKSVSLKSPARIYPGAPTTDIDAVRDVRLTRVIDEFSDTLFVSGIAGRPHVEVPWSNIGAAERIIEEKASEAEKVK